MTVKTASLTLIATLVLATTVPAFAQSGDNTGARLNRLENEIQTLSRAVFKGEAPPPGLFDSDAEDSAGRAQTELRLGQIEDDMRLITGRMEEQSHEMRRMQGDLEEALQQIENLQAQLEVRANAQPVTNSPTLTGTRPQNSTGNDTGNAGGQLKTTDMAMPENGSGEGSEGDDQSPSVDVVPDTANLMGQLSVNEDGELESEGTYVSSSAEGPTAEYERAFAMLKNNDFSGAEQAFEAFVEAHPEHDLAPNAMYWLGETHYVRNQYERAARVFAEAYQKYPEGPKGPDNLLKLALSLAGTGDEDNACLTLKQLERQYPDGTGPVLSRAGQEKQKLGCE